MVCSWMRISGRETISLKIVTCSSLCKKHTFPTQLNILIYNDVDRVKHKECVTSIVHFQLGHQSDGCVLKAVVVQGAFLIFRHIRKREFLPLTFVSLLKPHFQEDIKVWVF